MKKFIHSVGTTIRSLWKSFVLIMTLDCPESAEICSKELDQDLSVAEWIAVRIHLAICRKSRKIKRHLVQMHRILSNNDLLEETRLSETAKKRINDQINQQIKETQSENHSEKDTGNSN